MKHQTGKASSHRLHRNQQGSALLTALLLTIVLAVIVGASLSRSLYTWNEMGVTSHRESAIHAAESGAEIALFAVNHRFGEPNYAGSIEFEKTLLSLCNQDLSGPLTGNIDDYSGEAIGTYRAGVEFDPVHVERAVITATGTVPPPDRFTNSRVSRTIKVVVERSVIKPEVYRAAIYTPAVLGLNGITEVHGLGMVGENLWASENIDPIERFTSYEYEYWDEETQSVQTATGEVDLGRNLDSDPDNDVVLPFDEFILEFFKEEAMVQGNYYDEAPKAHQLPSTFFQPDGVTPNIVFITDTMRITGNCHVGGLIFIVGDMFSNPEDVIFGGDITVDGIIYTTGQFNTVGGGHQAVNVFGGAFCGEGNLLGNAVIEYKWEYFEALKDLVFLGNRYRFRSWQEIVANANDSSSTIIDGPSDPGGGYEQPDLPPVDPYY
jgi:hypothetical protein